MPVMAILHVDNTTQYEGLRKIRGVLKKWSISSPHMKIQTKNGNIELDLPTSELFPRRSGNFLTDREKEDLLGKEVTIFFSQKPWFLMTPNIAVRLEKSNAIIYSEDRAIAYMERVRDWKLFLIFIFTEISFFTWVYFKMKGNGNG